ncbi:hypothetical protein PC110_g12790 [Phytophthora cactorum]|uniref:Uncharacterized protein n=1 Tax=Phytophthora cactorum TaxID=29920 RepID=A0A329S297_9STRA|nr:hypothetical protein PC110_g12790 [Phytophthora cactorum]
MANGELKYSTARLGSWEEAVTDDAVVLGFLDEFLLKKEKDMLPSFN